MTLGCDPGADRYTARWSYDEQPGMPALRAIGPDRPPQPGVVDQAIWERDDEYQRLGTRTLPGIVLAMGEVVG